MVNGSVRNPVLILAIDDTNLVKTDFSYLGPRISNCTHYKMCDGIIYPFRNFNSATVEVWEWINNFIPHFTGHFIIYLSLLYVFCFEEK